MDDELEQKREKEADFVAKADAHRHIRGLICVVRSVKKWAQSYIDSEAAKAR